jgi:hypothetical protein
VALERWIGATIFSHDRSPGAASPVQGLPR